jgi:hypothetical protein
MPQYQGIPNIPNESIPQWQYDVLAAMKENLEILMGVRGDTPAVTTDLVRVSPQNWQLMTQVSARGEFTTSAATGVPTIADYIRLLNDVQLLASDVARIQDALNTLIKNTRQ